MHDTAHGVLTRLVHGHLPAATGLGGKVDFLTSAWFVILRNTISILFLAKGQIGPSRTNVA